MFRYIEYPSTRWPVVIFHVVLSVKQTDAVPRSYSRPPPTPPSNAVSLARTKVRVVWPYKQIFHPNTHSKRFRLLDEHSDSAYQLTLRVSRRNDRKFSMTKYGAVRMKLYGADQRTERSSETTAVFMTDLKARGSASYCRSDISYSRPMEAPSWTDHSTWSLLLPCCLPPP